MIDALCLPHDIHYLAARPLDEKYVGVLEGSLNTVKEHEVLSGMLTVLIIRKQAYVIDGAHRLTACRNIRQKEMKNMFPYFYCNVYLGISIPEARAMALDLNSRNDIYKRMTKREVILGLHACLQVLDSDDEEELINFRARMYAAVGIDYVSLRFYLLI